MYFLIFPILFCRPSGNNLVPTRSPIARDVFNFLEKLDRLATPEQLVEEVRRMLRPFGFKTIIFTGINPERPFLRQVWAQGWPSEFLHLYGTENFLAFDPIARCAERSSIPFSWDKTSFAYDHDPRVVRVRQIGADFGLRAGFVVPLYGADGQKTVVAMTGESVEITPAAKPALHLLALYAFDRIRFLSDAPPNDTHALSQREREVLAWVARGKSAWEIGEILRIAKRTVDYHSASAVRKLGAKSRTHAVAIAIRERAIDI